MEVTTEEKHTGSYSLKSTATTDDDYPVDYQFGRFHILITVEKNKFIGSVLSIAGTDTTDKIGFRVSSAISPTYTVSPIGTVLAKSTAQMKDPTARQPYSMGWLIHLNNSGTGEWIICGTVCVGRERNGLFRILLLQNRNNLLSRRYFLYGGRQYRPAG